MLEKDVNRLSELQDILYASKKHSLLIVIQAIDAAGKDGTIKHVMSGINPQGCYVQSFKQPTDEELAHDFLWRVHKEVPQKGMIAIFNRSHYEEVLVVRVHPEYLSAQNLPAKNIDDNFWQERFNRIKSFEKLLFDSGTIILKFFLNVSKEEQKKRFLDRIEEPEKNWKFSANDVKEREHWNDYMQAYEKAISDTSTEWAPWYVIPADNKWFMRAAVGDIIVGTLESLDLKYPDVSEKEREELKKCKELLTNE